MIKPLHAFHLSIAAIRPDLGPADLVRDYARYVYTSALTYPEAKLSSGVGTLLELFVI